MKGMLHLKDMCMCVLTAHSEVYAMLAVHLQPPPPSALCV